MRKILFMGTPEFAAHILTDLIASNYEVVAVVTQPDKIFGRKREVRFSEVKQVAIAHNINVIQPINIKQDFHEILDYDFDIIVTAAYGQIISEQVLNHGKFKSVNVHGSLLPKYRGGAPIHKAIYEGDNKTGITIMRMIQKMDAGNIISQQSVDISIDDNYQTVHDKLKVVGSSLLIETLEDIFNEVHTEIIQNESLTCYSPNISREDELINFNRKCFEVHNHVRAYNPFPGAYFNFNNKVYKIFEAIFEKCDVNQHSQIYEVTKKTLKISCNDGVLIIKTIKPEGKKMMDIKSFLNGKHDFITDEFVNV